MPRFTTKIENIVVLVLENRSFDHMLGFLPGVNGLKGDEGNHTDPASPGSPFIQVSRDAQYLGDLDIDPSHEVTNVNEQLFGSFAGPQPGGAHNIGFVSNYARQQDKDGNFANGPNIMKCFDPAKLPVLTKLAKEFAVCDRWHSSVPGQTWPNRFFLHCATSDGFVDNQPRHYGMRTIYENIMGVGLKWAIYFHDFPQSLALANLTDSALAGNFRFFPEFFQDLKNGTLPNYSFLEPRYFNFLSWKANDQHPPHDVQLGDHLIADVYEQLRQSSYWNKSLLVILWDEHGGIYDHELPPPAVNPDGKVSIDPPFAFDRLGLRVPAVLVSPLIAKGTVDSTLYDHTSLLATVRELFNLPDALTERDRRANTFTALLDNALRKDKPAVTRPVDQPEATEFHEVKGAAAMTADRVLDQMDTNPSGVGEDLSEFQDSLVELANQLDVPESPRLRVLRLARQIDDEHDAAVHVREVAAKFVESNEV
jgi:phospholipase C